MVVVTWGVCVSELDDLMDRTVVDFQKRRVEPPAAGLMNPVCAECKGACCQSFVVSIPANPDVDVVRWLGLRGEIRNGALRLNVPCRELTDNGTCGIWASRPKPCHDYEVGGVSCRRAIVDRRSDRADVLLDMLDAWQASSSPPDGFSLSPGASTA